MAFYYYSAEFDILETEFSKEETELSKGGIKVATEMRFFRAGHHPLTNEFEAYIDKINYEGKEEWGKLPFLSQRTNVSGTTFLTIREGENENEKIELCVPADYVQSMTLNFTGINAKTLFLTRISLENLPKVLREIEIIEIDDLIAETKFSLSISQQENSEEKKRESLKKYLTHKQKREQQEINPFSKDSKQTNVNGFFEPYIKPAKEHYNQPDENLESSSDLSTWLNMQTLGLLVGALGATGVTVAVVVLNVVGLGTPLGITLLCLGILASIASVGLFFFDAIKECTEEEEPDSVFPLNF
ncbi:MAG: hypothetical protein H0U73_11250 [Tatlockia sp.]|nr:hypothetical protein [Tatlockia sp.]